MNVSTEQRRIFNSKVLDPVVQKFRPQNQLLSGFMAMEGRDYAKSRKLMVVGRAVNGWGEGRTIEALRGLAEWDDFVESIHNFDSDCKMAWVAEAAGCSDGYNTNNSAFWRVIKMVSKALGVWAQAEEERWSSRLVWSNLYKISPQAGGNPSDALCALQEPGCTELLRQELIEYAPERVLFLTGMTWAWPFMAGLGCHLQASQGLVEARGSIELPGELASIPFVVAAHPQGKDESSWVQQVLEAFRIGG